MWISNHPFLWKNSFALKTMTQIHIVLMKT
uniref:Uncharacterized protein n=1 Tax=Rhizophora mucronata TaxID=61149 RepID=A0A2P2N3J9_RHIMU